MLSDNPRAMQPQREDRVHPHGQKEGVEVGRVPIIPVRAQSVR
jgi:hypothetical protein